MTARGDVIKLIGDRFGKLVVDRLDGTKTRTHWICRCECGRELSIRQDALRSQASCGCAHRRMPPDGLKRHGLGDAPEAVVWRSMITRCNNPKQKNWTRYGGRGIKVCDRWLNSFVAFLADMGPMPSPLHTIERENNDGNYEPTNCIWATRIEQCNNTSRNHIIEFAGERLTLIQWSRRLGIKRETIQRRLERGMTVERALTTGDFRRC